MSEDVPLISESCHVPVQIFFKFTCSKYVLGIDGRLFQRFVSDTFRESFQKLFASNKEILPVVKSRFPSPQLPLEVSQWASPNICFMMSLIELKSDWFSEHLIYCMIKYKPCCKHHSEH